jgi:hypothetical protein
MENTQEKEQNRRFSWPQATTVIAVVAIVVGAGVYISKSILEVPHDVAESGREVLHDISKIAEAFRTGTVTTTFISYAAEVSGSNYLQFATLKQTEVFQRKESGTALWGQLELPDVVVQARAPVEYTYFLDLDGRWEMRLENHKVLVLAPEIQFNTPAIDASAIRYEVREGSIFRNEDEALERLRNGVMQMSRQRARQNIELIREMGRRKTEEFVHNWLAHSFSDGDVYDVEVAFADEQPSLEKGDRKSPEVERPIR